MTDMTKERARFEYTFRLTEDDKDRCADCAHLAPPGQRECSLLDIAIANVRRSRCPLWERNDD